MRIRSGSCEQGGLDDLTSHDGPAGLEDCELRPRRERLQPPDRQYPAIGQLDEVDVAVAPLVRVVERNRVGPLSERELRGRDDLLSLEAFHVGRNEPVGRPQHKLHRRGRSLQPPTHHKYPVIGQLDETDAAVVPQVLVHGNRVGLARERRLEYIICMLIFYDMCVLRIENIIMY